MLNYLIRKWLILRKPARLWLKLLIMGLCCGFLLLYVALQIHCPIRRLIGIPCPGCGMTRAWKCLLQLDLPGAFSHHPMFWSVPLVALFVLYDCRLFRRPWLNTLVLGLVLAGFLVCYFVRLPGFLDGSIPI